MKPFLFHSKRISIISSTLLLTLSSAIIPTMAHETNHILLTQAPTNNSERPHPHPHKRPFRRFTAALESLKQEGLVSSDDIKKIYDALMKIPPETLDSNTDRDLAAADALYKDKVLTEEQYNKICTFLKQNAPRRP